MWATTPNVIALFLRVVLGSIVFHPMNQGFFLVLGMGFLILLAFTLINRLRFGSLALSFMMLMMMENLVAQGFFVFCL